MEDHKRVNTLQRRTVPGPKMLSEFATQSTKKNTANPTAVQKDKKFAVVQTYISPKEKTGDNHIFESLRLEGVISVNTMLYATLINSVFIK